MVNCAHGKTILAFVKTCFWHIYVYYFSFLSNFKKPKINSQPPNHWTLWTLKYTSHPISYPHLLGQVCQVVMFYNAITRVWTFCVVILSHLNHKPNVLLCTTATVGCFSYAICINLTWCGCSNHTTGSEQWYSHSHLSRHLSKHGWNEFYTDLVLLWRKIILR